MLLISCDQDASTQSPNPTSCVKVFMETVENHTRYFSSYLAGMNVKRTSELGTSFVFFCFVFLNNAQCQCESLGNWVGVS